MKMSINKRWFLKVKLKPNRKTFFFNFFGEKIVFFFLFPFLSKFVFRPKLTFRNSMIPYLVNTEFLDRTLASPLSYATLTDNYLTTSQLVYLNIIRNLVISSFFSFFFQRKKVTAFDFLAKPLYTSNNKKTNTEYKALRVRPIR